LKVFCNALIITTLCTRENCIIFTPPFSWGLRLIYIIYRYNRKTGKKVDFRKN
jgi:hypothetical protein